MYEHLRLQMNYCTTHDRVIPNNELSECVSKTNTRESSESPEALNMASFYKWD